MQARAARAEALREHARVLELGTRVVELEARLTNQARACGGTPDSRAGEVAPAREPPKPDVRRSEGDFLAEARVVAPAPGSAAATAAAGTSAPAAPPAPEREGLQQLLDDLHAYLLERRNGLSLERREALRVLLRRDRELDPTNPWGPR